jgi:hypothetical protein
MVTTKLTLDAIKARPSKRNRARIEATTEDDIRRHMIEDGEAPAELLSEKDIISPWYIRKRLGQWSPRRSRSCASWRASPRLRSERLAAAPRSQDDKGRSTLTALSPLMGPIKGEGSNQRHLSRILTLV